LHLLSSLAITIISYCSVTVTKRKVISGKEEKGLQLMTIMDTLDNASPA